MAWKSTRPERYDDEDEDAPVDRLAVRFWAVVVSVVVGLAIIVLVLGTNAWGHDFYSQACCSDRDCGPALPGEVMWTPAGYVVSRTSETIPLDDKRIQYSPPGEPGYRLCIPSYEAKVRCLYLPEPEG